MDDQRDMPGGYLQFGDAGSKQGAIAAYQKSYSGYTCNIVDPPTKSKETSQAIGPEPANAVQR